MANRKLTGKQELFVRHYLASFNGTQAAIAAGYGKKNADVQAGKLMALPHVRERIDAAVARLAPPEVTAERVIAELAKMAFANMADYMKLGQNGDPYLDFSGLTRDQSAALVEVTVEEFKDGGGKDAREVRRVKFKLADKRAALVDIGKHLGLFPNRHELTAKDGQPLAFTFALDHAGHEKD